MFLLCSILTCDYDINISMHLRYSLLKFEIIISLHIIDLHKDIYMGNKFIIITRKGFIIKFLF